ncbi:MAG: NlpC/P60 family protein [Pseudomonadota bacterium]
MIDPLDPRRNAIRQDLADMRLKSQVERPRYAEPTRKVVVAPSTRCLVSPGYGGPFDTEFLFGERVKVFDVEDDEGVFGVESDDDEDHPNKDAWSWVQSAVDGYVGYVASADLADAPAEPATHIVSAVHGTLYSEPSIKRGHASALPLGAVVTVADVVTTKESYARVINLAHHNETLHAHGIRARLPNSDEGYVLVQHLSQLDALTGDWVAVAERFLGVPYVWGGKTPNGIDCSGLVQLSLAVAGHAAPRDSDMQMAELGNALPDGEALRRGDLIFWRGHVGIMVDGERLLHANGFHMVTAIEPLQDTVGRLENMGLPVTARKRLDFEP